MQNVIKALTKILEQSKWTQSQLAQELGVTFATVNRWLNAHTSPHPAQKRQIEALFKKIVGIEPLKKQELRSAFQRARKAKGRFKNIKKILRNERVADEFLLELTYNSDAIEGSTLTKNETEAIIFDKATIKNKSLVEHLEAVNHAAILRDIFSGSIQAPITEGLILKMHARLMQGIRVDAGEYARHQRAIRGVSLALPDPRDIPEEMKRYFKRINKFKGNPVAHIAKLHADFEAIHPFGDGNGRLGRLIMIIQLISKGFAPCVIALSERAKYYEVLEYAQRKSETHLIHFLAEAVLCGYEIIRRVK